MRSFLCFLLLFFFNITSTFSLEIERIEIVGNKRISNETIIVLGDLDITKITNDNELNESFKKLFDSNFFNEINFIIQEKTLLIEIQENPIIFNIEVIGIKNKSFLDLIEKNMNLKNRMSFNENLFKKDLNTIETILKSNGYFFSKISTNSLIDDVNNSIDIKINIELGKKAKIKQITFLGNKIFKEKELLDIITSEESKFWKFISNRVYLDKSRIDLDKRLLEGHYRNLGYYDVKILDSFAELTNEGDFNLIFNIDAGKIFYFENLTLNLPDDYNKDSFSKIEDRFKKIKNNTYSLDTINEILDDIETIASLKQYEFINVNVDETIINDKISFKFYISDSDKFFIEKINILGNYNTYEEVIRNKLIVDEGDPLNNILLNKSLNELRSTGFFKDVDLKIKNASDPNFKILDIEVEEKPTGQISLGAGYGTSGSTIGGGISEKNFLGKGINLVTNLELSENSIKGEFSYSKPNFNYSDNTLITSLRSTTSDFLTEYGYKVSTVGISLGTEFEQLSNLKFRPEIEISLDDLETNDVASANLKKQEGKYEDFYFNYSLNFDKRNSSFKPTNGNNLIFAQNLPLISGNNEITNNFVFTQYHPFNKSKDMIGKAGFYFKSVNTIDDSDVRVSKRAQLPYSRLRGFEKGKIGPIDNKDFIGGNFASSINLSTNLPFLLRTVESLELNYFIDIGNVWGVDYDNYINDSNFLRSSTGLGLDFISPIGPLSFSISQPITKKNTDKTESFRFNLGTTF